MFIISIPPIAFTIGSLPIRWYGIMVALAVIALIAVILRETKSLGVSQDIIYALFLWGIIGGFVGAKVVYLINQWHLYGINPSEIISPAGLALYGAIGGALVGAWLYTRVKKFPFSNLAGIGDALAVGAPLAQAIGRVGCTINGCCFGKLSPFHSFPGAVYYSPHYTIPSQYWTIPTQGRWVALFPAQIYFLIWNLIVFAIIWQLRGRLKPQGSLFFLYLCLYAAGDFGLRFFRVNDPFLFGLHEGQVISLAILVVALPWLVLRIRRFQSSCHSEPQAKNL